jgi:alpha-tubulin suppressor-like RCC1 family protein
MSLFWSVRRLRAASILPLVALAAACGDPSGSEAEDRPVALAAGGDHTCALTGGGAAYCWGSNDRGQLGDGTRTASAAPVRVDAPERLVEISASWRQTCAVGASGSLYCWGDVAHGVEPTFNGVPTPDRVTADVGWASVSAGLSHGCALDRDGRAHCWGSDEVGELGDGPALMGVPAPVPVATAERFSSIRAAGLHSCGLAQSGTAYCWGYTPFGVVGTGANRIEPVPVAVGNGLRFTSFDTGATHACSVSAGDVHCWGMNRAGELGRAPLSETAARVPAAVAGLPDVETVFTSRQNSVLGFTCALTAAGEAFCWGQNRSGELGVAPNEAPSGSCESGPAILTCATRPARAAPSLRFRTLALGAVHACGITREHQIQCWGRSDEGQLGPDPAAGGPNPVRVELPES